MTERIRDITDKVLNERDRIIVGTVPQIDCPQTCFLCCSTPLQMRFFDTFDPYEIDEVIYEENPLGNVCGQLKDGRCLMYETRPFICHIFWKRIEDLPCHGKQEPERYLSKEEYRRLLWCWQFGTLQDARAFKVWMKGR